MVKLYAINDRPAYYYTPVYFTTDRKKAERLVEKYNKHHHDKLWEWFRAHPGTDPGEEKDCQCSKYEIVEEELDGPDDHLAREYPNSDPETEKLINGENK